MTDIPSIRKDDGCFEEIIGFLGKLCSIKTDDGKFCFFCSRYACKFGGIECISIMMLVGAVAINSLSEYERFGGYLSRFSRVNTRRKICPTDCDLVDRCLKYSGYLFNMEEIKSQSSRFIDYLKGVRFIEKQYVNLVDLSLKENATRKRISSLDEKMASNRLVLVEKEKDTLAERIRDLTRVGFTKIEFDRKFPSVNHFYNSTEWALCRAAFLKVVSSNGSIICQQCKRDPSLYPAKHVHHINDPRYYPEIALDGRNLIALCEACHNQWHGRSGGIDR